MQLLALTARNGVRIAEIGFVVLAVAGAALAVAALAPPGSRRIWRLLGGVALVVAALLLILATHWGHFGSP